MRAGHQCLTGPRFLSARPGGLRGSLPRPFHLLQVREQQLGLDGLDVVERRHPARDVGDVPGFEAAHDVHDRPRLAHAGQKPVSEPFPLRRTGHQPRDVDELHRRRHHALGPDDRGDPFETRVGHRHDADIRLDGAERIVLRRHGRARQRVVQRGLADVRQPDDPALDAHSRRFSCPASSSPRRPARRMRAVRKNALRRRANRDDVAPAAPVARRRGSWPVVTLRPWSERAGATRVHRTLEIACGDAWDVVDHAFDGVVDLGTLGR